MRCHMTIKEFEKQYEQLYMPLGMYALRMLGDVEESEDIVQNSFISAWGYIHDGNEIANFKAFMYRTVYNAVLQARRQNVTLLPLDEQGDVPPEEIDTSERDAALWRAIDELPDRCRDIFLLSKRDGLSNAAIAEELGISVKTVENQMTKAFSKLRGELKGRSGMVFFLPFL